MEHKPDIQQKEKPRLRLPFVKRKVDVWEWIYDHRVGLCVTVIAYLLMGIAFVSAKIIVGRQSMVNTIIIDIEPEEQKKREKIAEEIRRLQENIDYSSVKNLSSNENAKLDAGLRDDRKTRADDIYREAEAVQERMRASADAYNRGLREEQEMIAARRARNSGDDGKGQTREDRKVKGKVTVSFSLEGRNSVYLHVPAYLCEGGGEVVVAITVNRNGKVTGASVVRGESSSDECLTEMAVNAARRSRFNVSSSAPDPQKGSISYIFIPQ